MTRDYRPRWQRLADDPEFQRAVLTGGKVRDLMRQFRCGDRTVARARRWMIEGPPEDRDTLDASPAAAPPRALKPAPKEPTTEVKADGDRLQVDARGQGLVRSLEDLVREAGIDLGAWRVTAHKVKTWTTTLKGPDSLPRIVRNWGVTASLEPRALQESAARIPRVLTPIPRAAAPEDAKPPTCLIISDPQVGFRRRSGGKLEPMHDRRALDILLQLAAELQPEVIVCLGDALDLAEWSTRYPRPLELQGTTEATQAEWYWWLAQFRATCPGARIVWLEGNHEARIRKALTEKLPVAAALAAVGADRVVSDMRTLFHLDDLGVEYVGPYPEPWWWNDIEFKHGTTVRAKSGATVAAEIREAHHSMVFGHLHRYELAYKTIWGPKGSQEIFAASLGCTARVAPGVVPGVKPRNNWIQAFGVVSIIDGDSFLESNRITKGRTTFRGKLITGADPTDRLLSEIGYPMAVNWRKPNE